MKTNKKTRYGKILILISLLILFSNTVFAFAVSSAYYSSKPLYMLPGETKEDGLITLQNLGGSSDIEIKAEIITGSEILELTDPSNEYLVPAGQKTKVNFKITIPNNAQIDDVYPIHIRFGTEGAGGFGFGISIPQKFNVIIGAPPEPEEKPTIAPWIIGLIVGIIVLIIIIILMRRKKKK